ncbi:hypothetical protein ACQPX6_08965 [Actinomycetospora sp. CA-101289]|uniref:hypothetical protein n=1 Tax=Actinomycetospora sp. CA-101289 TaxID=3239893 RepID=UPI003D99AF00
MTDRTHDENAPAVAAHDNEVAAELARPTRDPTVPPGQLSDRELLARAKYCDEIARTGSPADRVGALRDLDATRDEAERRAVGQPADSLPAQVAGYIGLVREDDDRALAAEAATWRRQLDAALRPAVSPPADRVGDEVPLQRAPAVLGQGSDEQQLDERQLQEMLMNETPLRRAFIRASFTDDIAPVPAQTRGRERADLGETVLTVEQRADRAQSLAQGAGVDVAGYDPDTDVYTDPETGEIVRLDGRLADGPPTGWAADRHEAYLDSRPDETSASSWAYNPGAEYGDPNWREPASDDEAAARTAWLEQNNALAPGWVRRPRTEVEDALDDAGEQAVLSDRAHDHDPVAWAEYQRLLALSELAPLPDQPDALDRRQAEEAEEAAVEEDERYVDYEGRSWPSVDAWVTARADPAKAADTSHPDDLPRLRQRLADLQAQQVAHIDGEQEAEQRREQLTRWHQDDHATADTGATAIHAAESDETGAGGAGEGR